MRIGEILEGSDLQYPPPKKWADAAKDMQALEANAEIPVEVNAINAYED